MVAVQYGIEGKTQPLDPIGVNSGFTELAKVTFSAPTGARLRLLVDDELLNSASTSDGGTEWHWQPGFYAGEVSARLENADGHTIETYRLDVGPSPAKLGVDVFERMVQDILDFDPTLLLGSESAQRRLGTLDPTDHPLVQLKRLRSRRDALARALVAIRRDSATVLQARRRFVPVREVRRADLATLRSAIANPRVLAGLPAAADALNNAAVSSGGTGKASGATEELIDTPATERTPDSPANRAALVALRGLRRQAAALPLLLEKLAKSLASETRTDLHPRLPQWKPQLQAMEKAFLAAERCLPFSDVTRAEITAAGLNAIAAHPTYSRFWTIAWQVLRPRAGDISVADLMPLAPTWEMYERWCFVALAKQLREWLPKPDGFRRQRDADPNRWTVEWRFKRITVTLQTQATFRNTHGKPGGAGWAVSRERRPDLLLRWQVDDLHTDYILFDAKYTTRLLEKFSDTAHAYQDSLRWGLDGCRPSATFILAPNAESVGAQGWLTDPQFAKTHRVGVIEFNPDVSLPPWLQDWIPLMDG